MPVSPEPAGSLHPGAQVADKEPRSDGHAPSLPSWLERRLSLPWHFPIFSQHFTHSRDIVPVPRGGGRTALPPRAGSACASLLHKSSGFVQLLGQVWALELRQQRGVIPATCAQECALSDSPPGFSLFLFPSPPNQGSASPLGSPRPRHPQRSISKVESSQIKWIQECSSMESEASVFWTLKSSPAWTGAIPCHSGKRLR